jgi:hypothetical protein
MGVTQPSVEVQTRRAQLALWVMVVAAGGWLLYRDRNLWFGGDDWFILLDRRISPHAGQLGIFDAFNEHWTTLPILMFRGLYAVFGISTYWPYLVLLVLVHLAIVVLLWYVMTRAAIDPWVALGFTALTAIAGVGFENLTNVWQVPLILPLALGLGALLVLPERGRLGARDAGASLLLTIGMACSGLGITMLGVVALVALVRRGWRVAVAIAVLPSVAYAWWYLAYGRNAPDVADPTYGEVPRYVWSGSTDALGDLVRWRSLGVVIVLAAVVWLMWQLTRRPIDSTVLVPAALALGAGVSLALTGWRRGAIGDPATSRYAYITIVLFLPLLAAASEWCIRRLARARFAIVVPVVVGALLLLAVIAQVRMFDDYVATIEPAKRVEKGALLSTAVLAREGHRFLTDRPMYIYEPQVTVKKIIDLDRDDALPSLSGLRATDRYTVLARTGLVVAPGPLAGLGPNPSAVRLGTLRGARSTPVDGRADCVDLEGRTGATAQLLTDGGVTVGVHGDGTLLMHVARPDGKVRGEDVVATLDPESEQVLSIGDTGGAAVVLTLPKGTTRLCGVS